MFYLYFLRLQNGYIYTGSTSDLKRRIQEHNSRKLRATNKKRPRLIGYEAYVKKTDATRREKFLKTTAGKRLFRQQHRDVININGASPARSTNTLWIEKVKIFAKIAECHVCITSKHGSMSLRIAFCPA